jgi:rhodanese-related sulfurtransferase
MSQHSNLAICEHVAATDVAAITGDKVFLDVRSPIEFRTEHIDGSINIPLDEVESRFDELPRKARLVVICRTGNRAQRAAFALMGRGFAPQVLDGGLVAWRKAGLSLKEGKKRLAIERQIQLIVGFGVLAGVLLGVLANPWFFIVPAFFGAGLAFAGLSGTCALGILLGKAPWNKLEFTKENECSSGKSSCGS